MTQSEQTRKRCLWHASDDRCASCIARRMRHDVLGMKDYDMCNPPSDYASCEFYKEKPTIPKKN